MIKLYLRFSAILSIAVLGMAMKSSAQCLPRSGFYYGEMLPNNGCASFASYSSFGPGEYFRMPVLQGGSYTISTCGSGIDTQLTLFEGTNTTSNYAYNDDFGPDCPTSTRASITVTSTFTDYTRVNVNEYNCLPGGSQSITVKVRQDNNLSITSSSANMCEGQTRTLTATPAPVTGAQPNSGNSGTFSGTGVSGTTFTAPTPAGDFETFTITYTFGYCSTTQDITVYKNPTPANAGPDQTVCGSTATLAGNTPTVVFSKWWTVISGPGTVTSQTDENSTVTGLSFATPTTLVWRISHGPCLVSEDTVTIYREDNIPPSITCPGLQYATVDSFCNNQLADYTGLATASDLCGSVNVSQSPAPGTSINATTVVTLTATDEAGNLDSCSFTVKLAPTITHFSSRTDSQWRVNWEYSAATPNDTNFRVRYWEQGFPAAFTDHSQFPSNFQKKITGLESNTWYDVKVGFACANGDFIWGDTESVRTKKITCPTPLNHAQDLPAMENMASVTWDDQGATSYKFRYRPIGSSDWNYSTISSTTKNMGGLTPGTSYHYQLKALCTTGLWSSYTPIDTFVTTILPPGAARLASDNVDEVEFLMNLYPNPNEGLFTIDLAGKLSNTLIEVRNVQGALVHSIDLGDSDVARVDLSELAPGVYQVVALQDGERLATQKLIIE